MRTTRLTMSTLHQDVTGTCKISQIVTSGYHPSCKPSQTALTNYAVPEMLDIFSLWVGAELSVATTNSTPIVPPPKRNSLNPPLQGLSPGLPSIAGMQQEYHFAMLIRAHDTSRK